jgi:hypothetical protein
VILPFRSSGDNVSLLRWICLTSSVCSQSHRVADRRSMWGRRCYKAASRVAERQECRWQRCKCEHRRQHHEADGTVSFGEYSSSQHEGVTKSFWTESITKYALTTINTRWEATQMVMAGKLTRLTHKIAILLHIVAESCATCGSRSRRPVRKLLDTPS